MSEAGWGTDTPKVAGWYWWRGPAGVALPLLVLNCQEYQRWLGDSTWNLEQMADGEWLGPITPDAYAAGRVASLAEVERYMAMRLRLAEASLSTEILAGNEVKQGRERAAIAELHGMQRHVADIKEQIEAQGGSE